MNTKVLFYNPGQPGIPDMMNLTELLVLLLSSETKKDIPYYIGLLSKRFNSVDTEGRKWTLENTTKFLEIIYDVDPSTIYNILLKEIAIDLDKPYEGHILDSESLYVIGRHNGKITKVSTCKDINLKNIALFRTFEDAQTALKVLEDFHYVVYGQ